MLDPHAITAQDISALNPSELASLAGQLLAQINEQSKHITAQAKRIDSDAQAIKWRDAKIESITFQLMRLKAWKFGAKTERMNAQQRALFEETLAADQASLEAQLAALQANAVPGEDGKTTDKQAQQQAKRQPKREALPAHLPRVDTRIEPQDPNCPSPECGQGMVRVGEDISERLDIIPAQFRHGQGAGLQLETLGRTNAVSGRWAIADRQQLDREPDSSDCHWSQQLVVRWLPAGRAACGCGDESDTKRQAQWA